MGLFDKLSFGLKKTKGGIFGSITKAISGSMIDDDMYEDLLDFTRLNPSAESIAFNLSPSTPPSLLRSM